MLGRENDVVRAEDRIASRREYFDRVAAFAVKDDFAAGGFADPVFLHGFGLFGPIERGKVVEKFLGVFRDLKEPLRQIFADDRRAATLAGAVYDLFVREHGLAGRAPVDGSFLAIGEPFFVEAQEHPLRPFVVIFFAGFYLCAPVEEGAHRLELMLHRLDILFRGILGMHLRLDRIVLRRQTEGVESHGLKDVFALHFFESCIGIRGAVIIPVSDVELRSGRIREHFQYVKLVFRIFFVEIVEFCLFPFGLPFLLNRFHIHRPLPPCSDIATIIFLFYRISGGKSSKMGDKQIIPTRKHTL